MMFYTGPFPLPPPPLAVVRLSGQILNLFLYGFSKDANFYGFEDTFDGAFFLLFLKVLDIFPVTAHLCLFFYKQFRFNTIITAGSRLFSF